MTATSDVCSRIGAILACLATLAAPPMRAAQVARGQTAGGVYYEAAGAGEAIVFIHAFSVDRRMWDGQAEVLRDRFRVIRYDLRGHGNSMAAADSFAAYDDLRDVLDALGVGRATLVGLSAGAELALNFALAHPARVHRLVLASPGLTGHPSPSLPWTGPVFQAARAGDAHRAAELWAATPIMALRANPREQAMVTDLVLSNERIWTFRTRLERTLTPPAAVRLGEITCPSLVIVGDEDLPHIKEIAELIAHGVAGALLVRLPGAGHLINLDSPQGFNDAIARFLAAPPGGR